uniref:Uncharacterized protein n=1 Tax=mine drainage metagenome TaxID=410659 RepID=E6QC45_9ZZZZ
MIFDRRSGGPVGADALTLTSCIVFRRHAKPHFSGNGLKEVLLKL